MLNWNTRHIDNRVIHEVFVAETSEKSLRQSIEACTDKAIASLKTNIQDDSLYLLFEWNQNLATLNIFVTDSSKTKDSLESVCCNFSSLAIELARENEDQRNNYTDTIKFWLHDYLSTCTAFFSYSLVAIFHSSTRQNTELL